MTSVPSSEASEGRILLFVAGQRVGELRHAVRGRIASTLFFFFLSCSSGNCSLRDSFLKRSYLRREAVPPPSGFRVEGSRRRCAGVYENIMRF